jgi:cellulase/cellobiase CelA1
MAKHKYIETPEKMWELFQAYKNEVKSNPIKKHVFVGKDGMADYEERERPLTMEGFENYCNKIDMIADMGHYFMNRDNAYDEYVTICRMIKREIRQDQIEGGMTMIYNPSITQRLNGLVEKQHVDSNIDVKGLPINIITNSPPLANDEK